MDNKEINFKEIIINNKRSFYRSVYPLGYSKALERFKIIYHIKFLDRVKVYDIEHFIDDMNMSIKEFLQNNSEYSNQNTIFYFLLEANKGLGFSPDIRILKNFMANLFTMEKDFGFKIGQQVGIFPKFFANIAKMLASNYFGFERGVTYDIASSYKEAIKIIEGFSELIDKDSVPDPLHSDIVRE